MWKNSVLKKTSILKPTSQGQTITAGTSPPVVQTKGKAFKAPGWAPKTCGSKSGIPNPRPSATTRAKVMIGIPFYSRHLEQQLTSKKVSHHSANSLVKDRWLSVPENRRQRMTTQKPSFRSLQLSVTVSKWSRRPKGTRWNHQGEAAAPQA